MKNRYVMTDAQVEAFSRDMATAAESVHTGRTTYLRVLVAGCQVVLGKVKRGKSLSASTQLDVLADVSGRYYAAVLRGITTPELMPIEGLEQVEATRRSIERNKRSTFARTAKSTLVGWINSGGDLRVLDVETVTRDPLRVAVRASRGQTETSYKLERNVRAIVRQVTREAKDDPQAARADLEAAMEQLEEALDALADGNSGTRISVINGRKAPHRASIQ